MIKIANAIREKTGENSKILPTDFATKIREISVGHEHQFYWEWDQNEHWLRCSCGDVQGSWSHKSDGGYSEKTTKVASCYNPGEKQWTCSVCGGSGFIEIPATGHGNFVSGWTDVVEPTCETGGYTKVRCGYCDETMDWVENPTEPLGHDWVYQEDYYLGDQHYTEYKCDRCGQDKTEQESV